MIMPDLLGDPVTLFRVKPSSFPLMLSSAVSVESLSRQRLSDDMDKHVGICLTFSGQLSSREGHDHDVLHFLEVLR